MEHDAPHLAPGKAAEPRRHPDDLARESPSSHAGRPWRPKSVLVTASAARFPLACEAAEAAATAGAEVTWLGTDRLPPIKGATAAEGYRLAKSTLAVVKAPPSKIKPQPIPPSADWRFDLATGCPAHCQYCYLAGSLNGPPLTRLFANLDEIWGALPPLVGQGTVTSLSEHRAFEGTTFEASCYTDPLGIEHLGSPLSKTIERFGRWGTGVQLRFTTKFAHVGPLLGLEHKGRTRARFSVNAEAVVRRFEGGTSNLQARLEAMAALAGAGYPVGLTVAPIMPFEGWREGYAELIERAAGALQGVGGLDLTAELITHRFTPSSKDVLLGWYPATGLEMDERARSAKRNKFGGVKWIYPKGLMAEMRAFFEHELARTLPQARLLYWT